MRPASAPRSLLGRPRRLTPKLPGWGAAMVLLACGRPATEQECEQILERTARLELQERLGAADPKLIEAEVQSTKQAMRESMNENCVGKRITDRVLTCIDHAESAKELTEDCFK